MLSCALSSSHWTGWWLILRIQQTFNIWVRPPGRSFADKGGGNGDLSDNLNAAAPSCRMSDEDAWTISSLSEMHPTADNCVFWTRDCIWVAGRFWLPCHILKSREPWTFCAISFTPPLSSFLCRFLCSMYPILGQRLPQSRCRLEQTALKRLVHEEPHLWFLTDSSW